MQGKSFFDYFDLCTDVDPDGYFVDCIKKLPNGFFVQVDDRGWDCFYGILIGNEAKTINFSFYVKNVRNDLLLEQNVITFLRYELKVPVVKISFDSSKVLVTNIFEDEIK